MGTNENYKYDFDASDADTPAFAMWRAAESLHLIARHATEFRAEDRDEAASLCSIISDYLFRQADRFAAAEDE